MGKCLAKLEIWIVIAYENKLVYLSKRISKFQLSWLKIPWGVVTQCFTQQNRFLLEPFGSLFLFCVYGILSTILMPHLTHIFLFPHQNALETKIHEARDLECLTL